MALRIEDYAVIGDLETAALVGRNGSIDWLCLPRFDSDTCFAALLGKPENGRWIIAPEQKAHVTRQYRRDTLILETTFTTPEGRVRLIDFMPPKGKDSDLVRIVAGVEGCVHMRSELIIRFDYGSTVPWVTRHEHGIMQAVAGPQMLVLKTPAPLRGRDLTTLSEFTVSAGERLPFVLTHAPSYLPAPELPDAFAALEDAERFWLEWSGRCREAGPWSDIVRRSLITLKALTFAPTGGIAAAVTTSLPEWIGSVRNWDYRFCWLRDATLTLLALMDGGYYEEASAWRDWLVRAAAGSPEQLQIMYGIAGERRLWEWEVSWLDGYEGSKPVRIGNAAHAQLQLDVFGEMMDALYHGRCAGLSENMAAWALQLKVMGHLESIWRGPDSGIWEMRGPPQQFTYSKMMAWVAFDRAIKTIEEFGMRGPLERWKKVRAQIHEEVCRNGFDAELGSFVQAYGTKNLDASLLLVSSIGFLPPDDPRVKGTVAAIERDLLTDGFVRRYHTTKSDDGLPPGEGAFLACSFWLADAYCMLGRREEAERLFERLIGLCNDVGLLAEEYDATHKRLLGNFPQAFSHISLVNTAHNLSRTEKPSEKRGGHEAARQRVEKHS